MPVIAPKSVPWHLRDRKNRHIVRELQEVDGQKGVLAARCVPLCHSVVGGKDVGLYLHSWRKC